MTRNSTYIVSEQIQSSLEFFNCERLTLISTIYLSRFCFVLNHARLISRGSQRFKARLSSPVQIDRCCRESLNGASIRCRESTHFRLTRKRLAFRSFGVFEMGK